MSPWFVVALGSGLGATMRLVVSLLLPLVLEPGEATRLMATLLPTLLVNSLGALAIGGYADRSGLLEAPWKTPPGRFFFMAGFLGGFTTFSVFSLEAVLLIRDDQAPWAIGYGGLSLVLWLGAVWLGSWLARTFPSPSLPTALNPDRNP